MIISEEITAMAKEFIRYSLLLSPGEFAAARAEFEPLAVQSMSRSPDALAVYSMILDHVEEAVNSIGGMRP